MNSSQSSEKMHSSQRNETRTFTKYGVMYSYGVAIEERRRWDRMIKLPGGALVAEKDFDPNSYDLAPDAKLGIEWSESSEMATFEAVRYCKVQDDEYCVAAKDLGMYITADGQMLGIQLESTETEYVLLDPCVITFAPKTGAIEFKPIFGVQRTLRLSKMAVRASMAPAELIISAYPGFLIQHRMYRYQLKPSVAFNAVAAADNDATPVTTH